MAVLKYWDPTAQDYLPVEVGSSNPDEVAIQSGAPGGLDLWVDLDAAGSAGGVGLDQDTADSLYVNIAGDTMTGTLNVGGDVISNYGNFLYGANMGGYAVTAVGDPVNSNDAASKAYVDARIWQGTRAQYDAITTKDPTVLYVITG